MKKPTGHHKSHVFSNSGVNRRRFLTGATGLALATGILPNLTTSAYAETPRKGGTLRYAVGHGSTTDSLDPALFENDFTQGLCYTVHNHLAEVTPDGELIGEVAESWEASPDSRVWTFKIREGIEFHDGSSLRPEDVVASINYHRGDDSSSVAKPFVEPIVEMRIDGQNVVIELSSGNADFPFSLSDFHIVMMPSADGKIEDPLSGVGCGPYKLETFTAGVEAKFSRHPNYWKSNSAHFDAIEIQSVIDPNARTSALLSGAVDVIDKVEPKTASLLSRNQGVDVLSISGNQHYTFPMLVNFEPFSDVNVRRALKWAAPREQMVETILFGHGRIGNDIPIGKDVPFAANDLPQTTFDPDKARFHLKQSGMESIEVELSAADAAFAGAVDAAVLYSEYARQAGINIKVVREPSDGYWSNVWTKKPWCACYWGGRPTVDAMLSLAYLPGVAWNDTNWKNERFVDLVTNARAEQDSGLRGEMYLEVQQLIHEDGATVVPMFANYVTARSKKIASGAMASNWVMDGQKFAERWWFTA